MQLESYRAIFSFDLQNILNVLRKHSGLLKKVQLDMSIVSNLLASYSAEHLLAKGPASAAG